MNENEDFSTWTIKSRFRIGDIVYLKVADEPKRGMVTGIVVRQSHLIYYVSWATATETVHNDIELTGEYVPHFDQTERAESNG